jgi:hypothetical protein
MIKLDTRNGHDPKVIQAFNEVSATMSDEAILLFILRDWADDDEIECFTRQMNPELLDENGNQLKK